MKKNAQNLKLKKVTISKLDNLNLKKIEREQLREFKAGGDANFTTVDIITIGGGFNDTSHLSSCDFNYDPTQGEYTECISRSS